MGNMGGCMRSSRAVPPYDRHGRDQAPTSLTSCFKCIESSLGINIKCRWGLLVGVIRPPVTQSARSRRSILRKKRKKTGEWEQYSRVERRYNKGPRDWQNVLAITRLRYSKHVLGIVWRPLNA